MYRVCIKMDGRINRQSGFYFPTKENAKNVMIKWGFKDYMYVIIKVTR